MSRASATSSSTEWALRIDAPLAAKLLRGALVTPDALALQDDTRSWTHAEWAADVQRARVVLRAAQLPQGAAYAWLGHNSVAMLSMLVACALEHRRLLPLNWRLTPHEWAQQLQDADVVAWHRDEAFAIDGDRAWANRRTPVDFDPRAAAEDVLLVYTSGTTGEPRAAVHTQAGMVANIDAAIESQGLDARTRALAVLPLFHVGGLCIQVLPTLAAGGAVRLMSRFEPSSWFEAVASWRANTSLLVPAVMRALIDHPRWKQAALNSLRFVNAGSSIVPLDAIDAFHQRGIPVSQVYGSTETGPVTLVLRPSDALAHPGSVGQAAPGVEVKLIADEVWVRAPNLARGYHRRDEDPSFQADGWFRTGDLAEYCNGHYRIVGRNKDLIISGGENIHPAEIEQLTATLPGIADCVVVGRPDSRWGEVPVLVFVADPSVGDGPVPWPGWRRIWVERLARYKHPRALYQVSSLPKTALGKVRRAEVVGLIEQLQPVPELASKTS